MGVEGPRGLVSQKKVSDKAIGKSPTVRFRTSVSEDDDQSEGCTGIVKTMTSDESVFLVADGIFTRHL